jgi:hypothetical protein
MVRHDRIRWTMLAISAALMAACSGGTPSASPTAPSPTATPTSQSEAPVPTPSPTTAALRNPAAYVEGATYAPVIDPAVFGGPIDNPYFPLPPGTTYVFLGGTERNEVEVTHDTKVILGVTTVVVHDRVWDEDVLTEETYDWYAQDAAGNVWYFGEDTKSYESGSVSTEGSWEAGVDGALPGVIMLVDPQVGDFYREEYLAGQAEDVAKVTKVGGSATVAAGTYDNIILTENSTRLEPDVIEEKTYAPGVGFIFERYVTGGEGTVELTEIKTGG